MQDNRGDSWDDLFEGFGTLGGSDIYKKLNHWWKLQAIDRKVTWREVVLVPVDPRYARLGASIFIALLAYPNDTEKMEALSEALGAQYLKQSAPPRSPLRAAAREYPGLSRLIDIPNKRIQERLRDGERCVNKRLRAAAVLHHKLASHLNPAQQMPLRDIILKAAKQNTHAYPAFRSNPRDPANEDDNWHADSFRRQVMAESRPVAHLALAFYLRFLSGGPRSISLAYFLCTAEQWLKSTIIVAEMIRVFAGDYFPRFDAKEESGRVQNYALPLNETIAVLPYIDPIPPGSSFLKLLVKSGNGQGTIDRKPSTVRFAPSCLIQFPALHFF